MNLTWELLGLRHGDGRSVAKDLEEDREVCLQESVKTPLAIM